MGKTTGAFMANVFQAIQNSLNLHADSQGTGEQYSWLYLLLDKLGEMEAANPTGDTISGSPVRELLEVRLKKYSNTFAFKLIEAIMLPRVGTI
jgi:hypothetical protein